MANTLYDKGREAFLSGGAAWNTDTFKVVLLTASYTFSVSHNYLSDISAGFRVATSSALTGKTITAGVADASDITFTAVTGSAITQIAIFKDTGTESTSTLILYIDTATNMPITPNGGDITIQWSNGSSKIFLL